MNRYWRSGLVGGLLVLLLTFILAGCGSAAPETTGVNDQATAPTEVPAITATAVADQPAETAGFPVTIENCDRQVTFDAPPQRVVVNDVNILELFLALDLQDRLIGYSSVRVDKEIAPEYQAKLEGIPLLAERYPGIEVLAGAEPDFYLAGWNYGLSEASGLTPDSLAALGIQTYAITESCIRIMPREQVSLEDTFTDLLNLGKIFGVEERAQALVDQYRAELAEITTTIGQVDTPLRVFVYDSGEDTPLTAARFATPNAMIEAAGGTNIFNDVESSWTRINWEDVIERNPEYIVIIDYGQPDAQGKIDFLKSRAELADVDALQHERFVILTYAEATPGPRNVASTRRLAEAFYPDKFADTNANDEASTTETTTTYPLTIENGEYTLVFAQPPERAVSLNLHTTEIMLALGLEDRMVGTAFGNAPILPIFETAYNAIPILAERYPSLEVLVSVEPDFTYGRSSAHREDGVGTVDTLATLGINAYTVQGTLVEAATMADVYTDIRNLGRIFNIQAQAAALIESMEQEIAAVQDQISDVEEPVRVLVYDAGTDDLFTAGQSLQTHLIELAGGRNIFDDVEQNWVTVSWEEAVARDPDVIVINDYGNISAAEKIDFLLNNPALSSLPAIQNERLIVLPLPSVFEGVRNPDAVELLARGFYPDRFE